MRNLKRALSLALSTVMLVGMMAVGTSAASYADVTSAHNEEAIEVAQAISVMVGDENGNFNPDKNVTRAEMAVVMANLLDLKVQDFVGASIPFTDVPEWAHAYVAACYADGITGGISATQYGSNNSVTATQAALMLLKALGYFQYGSDFGTDWQVATIRQASNIQLFDGIDSARNAAMTRNEVAQIALNALEATMVEPDGTPGSVTTPDGTIVNLGSVTYNDRTSTNSKYAAINDDEGNNGRYTMELGEDLFDGDLEKNSNGHDDFYRPAHVWEYKGEEIGAYSDSADEVYVVEDKGQSINDIVTGSDYMNYKSSDYARGVEFYINGEEVNQGAGVKVGDVVEAYENSDKEVATVVVRSYTAAVIDSVSTDLSSSDERNGASVELTLNYMDDTEIGTYFDNYDDDADILTGYNDDYTEGTILAVALGQNDVILDSYVAEEVSGSVTAYKSGETVTIDGTKYFVADAAENDVKDLDFDEDYSVYLTEDGFVIGIEGATGANLDDVYYVVGTYGETSRGSTTYYAVAVSLADGTISDIELDDKEDLGIADEAWTVTEPTNSNLYTFNSKGAATKWTGDDDYAVTPTAVADADGVKVDDTRVNTDDGRFYLDDTTRYLAIDGIKADKNPSDVEASVATGGMKAGNDSKMVVITDKNDRDAIYVLYINAEANVSGDDVIYLAEADFEHVGTDQYEAEVYFMETGDSETVVLDNDDYVVGFYTYDVDEDDVYSLNKLADDGKYKLETEVKSDSDGWLTGLAVNNKTAGETYGNDAIYRNALRGTYAGVKFDDISMSGATVIDVRSTADREGSAYDRVINNTTKLADAVDALKDGQSVTINVYVTDGDITFICVTNVGEGSEEPEDPSEIVSGTGIAGVEKAPATVTTGTDLKSEADGVYIFSQKPTDIASDINGEIGENLFFKFETKAESARVTLVITNEDGDEVYREAQTFTDIGGHFFYVQVIGDDLNNVGNMLDGEGLPAGEYGYRIYTGNETLLSGNFEITK